MEFMEWTVAIGLGGLGVLAIIAVLNAVMAPDRAEANLARSQEIARKFFGSLLSPENVKRMQERRSAGAMRVRETSKRDFSLLGRFCMLAAGSVLLYVGANMLGGQLSRSWPWTEDAVVINSEVVHTAFGARNSPYAPSVEYEYRVDGRAHRSTRIFFGSGGRGRSRAQEICAAYRPGGPARVYYCPQLPALSVLVPGVQKADFKWIIAMSVLFLLGYGFSKKAASIP